MERGDLATTEITSGGEIGIAIEMLRVVAPRGEFTREINLKRMTGVVIDNDMSTARYGRREAPW